MNYLLRNLKSFGQVFSGKKYGEAIIGTRTSPSFASEPRAVSHSAYAERTRSNDSLIHDIGISVIVPVRDEAHTIRALLDSFAAQTRLPKEIVIVDAGSVDGTADLIKERAVNMLVPVRLVSPGPAYPGTARNIGVESASGSYLAFTDAGIQLDKHWLERLTDPLLATSKPEIVYGTYEPVLDTFFDRCAAIVHVPARVMTAEGPIRAPSIASCLLRRSVWEAVGGFPPYRASEDKLFFQAVQKQAFVVAHAPGAVAHWEIPSGLWLTYQKFAAYSYHNLIAGRGRYWHLGVVRTYVAALPFVVLAIMDRRAWLYVPVGGLICRVARTIWRKRNEKWGSIWNPFCWGTVAVTLMAIDAATFTGMFRWIAERLLCQPEPPLPAERRAT